MKHRESLRVLGLTESSSLQDLTSTFRKLVKKFHPDLNQDKPEWSNRQMLFLNEAYKSAYEAAKSTSESRKNGKPLPYYICPKCWSDSFKDDSVNGFCSNCETYQILKEKCVKR